MSIEIVLQEEADGGIHGGLEERIGELEAKVEQNTASLAKLAARLEDVVEAPGETRGHLLEQNVEENLREAFTGGGAL